MPDCIFEKDCLKAPISKKCERFCAEQILRRATLEEKQVVLRLTVSTSEAIFRAYQNYPISNFDDLALRLSTSQVEEILGVFRNISQEQLDHFIR